MTAPALQYDAASILWEPHQGPQSVFLASDAYEALYGGAAGGGKSDALLFGGLRQIEHPAYKALILRRTFPELRELMDRAHLVFRAIGGTWNESAKRYTFPSGAVYQFGYCIHGDTHVLMGTGRYRPMRSLRPGDLVQTLEGPRRVTRHWHVGMRPAVAIRVGDDVTIASESHALLTATGAWRTPVSFDGPGSAIGAGTYRTGPTQSSPDAARPREWSAPVMLHVPESRSRGNTARDSGWTCGAEHGPTQPAPQDFPDGYRAGSRSGGALALCEPVGAPVCTPRRAGADTHAPMWSPPDDLARTPGYSQSAAVSYCHPYTRERRSMSEAVRCGRAEMVRVGEQSLWDMSVEGANHYITKSGLIHKNCESYSDVLQYQGQQFTYIAFDELGQVHEERIWTYLMSRNRSAADGLVKQMRASANPGGPGHHWIKRRFIATCPPTGSSTTVRLRDGSASTRAFVQAFLSDNPTLLRHDPDYAHRLSQLPELEYKWLAEGDWEAGAGLGLSDLKREVHMPHGYRFAVPEHWTIFGGFDWGYAHPFSFGLYAADEGGTVYKLDTATGRRLQPPQIAERIFDALDAAGIAPHRLKWIAAGHDCWADVKARAEHVPTIAEHFTALGLPLVKANISRVAGVQNMRRYLQHGPEQPPRFRLFDTPGNQATFACLETRVADPDHLEDILKTDADENGEGGDDTYDETRYALASRPIVPKLQAHSAPHKDRAPGINWERGKPGKRETADEALAKALAREGNVMRPTAVVRPRW